MVSKLKRKLHVADLPSSCSNITMFVVARAVYAMFLTYKGIQPVAGSLEVHPSEMVQTALFWSERMRQLSGILLVITALSECVQVRYRSLSRAETDPF